MPDPKHAVERPATFGEVFADREFRAVFSASAFSWMGDYIARAAVTALVLSATGSVALSAAAFAVTYLPYLTVGPILTALADRHPPRVVMVSCDVARACLIALVAIPHLPVQAVLALLFTTALLNPPFDASRSALLPRILHGDQYVVGLAASATTNTTAQILGYATGGIVGAFHPSIALLIDAATFVISACLIGFGTRSRPAVAASGTRKHLLRETAAGFRLVLSNPVLRAIAAVALAAYLFATVPEGLAAAWASELSGAAGSRGAYQAVIMMSGPVGSVIGTLIVGRLLAPARRRQLIRPLAVVVPAALAPLLVIHSVFAIAICAAISGFAAAGLLTPANGLFVMALPSAFRARAFGVMQFGLWLVQGASVLGIGLVGDHINLYRAIGTWGLGGTVAVALILGIWPAAHVIDRTISETQAANAAAEADEAARTGTLPDMPADAILADAMPIDTMPIDTIPIDTDPRAQAGTPSQAGASADVIAETPPPGGRHAARPAPRAAPRQALRTTPTGYPNSPRRQDAKGEYSET